MRTLTKEGASRGQSPRMTGGVRRTALPLLRGAPDPGRFVEHRTEDGRRAFVAKSVLCALERLERLDHPIETACLLFGGFFSDGENPCAIVTKLVFPEPEEVIGTRSTVTITAEGAERMIVRAWREDPLLKPLGWGHTHPLFEAYFSHVDLEEQRVWKEPASVGIVISGLEAPKARYRVFVGPESEPAKPVTAAIEEPAAPEPAVPAGPVPPTVARAGGRAWWDTRATRLFATALVVSALTLLTFLLLTRALTASADQVRPPSAAPPPTISQGPQP